MNYDDTINHHIISHIYKCNFKSSTSWDRTQNQGMASPRNAQEFVERAGNVPERSGDQDVFLDTIGPAVQVSTSLLKVVLG